MSHATRNRRRALGASAVLAFALAVGLVGNGVAASAARPANLTRPAISGTAQEGQTLTGDRGQWANSPTDFNYFWLRCGQNGGGCAVISGANSLTYKLGPGDAGHTMRFRVVASNGDGSRTAVSVPTAVVTTATPPTTTTAPPPPPPPPPSPPSPGTGCPGGSGVINIASLGLPARLLIDATQFSPGVITAGTSQFSGRFHVTACGGRPVQGALVYVTAVPFNQFSIPAEQQTGADGWAQLTFQQLSGFPASSKQQLLALFARARKSGENLLAGVSTRRLVSVRVNLNG